MASNDLFALQNKINCLQAQVKSLEQKNGQVSSADNMNNSGGLLWIVDNISNKQELEKSLVSLGPKWTRSPVFYSHPEGYKFHLEVSFNGKGTGINRAVSIAVSLISGENDDQLTWPFNKLIIVSLMPSTDVEAAAAKRLSQLTLESTVEADSSIQQRTRGNAKKVTIAPDWNSSLAKRPAWNRPRGPRNPPLYVNTNFVSLQELARSHLSGNNVFFKVEFKENTGQRGGSNPIDHWISLPFGIISHNLDNGNILFRFNSLSDEGSNRVCYIYPEQLTPLKNYFEIRLNSLPDKTDPFISGAAIGLSEPTNCGYDCMPGWFPGSIGFHSDDGQLFKEFGMGVPFAEVSKDMDVLGCGIKFKKRMASITEDFTDNNTASVRVFFTKNGARIGEYIEFRYPPAGLFPSIGFIHSETEVEFTPPYFRQYLDFLPIPTL